MDAGFLRRILIDSMRRHRKTLAEARLELIHGMRLSDTSEVDAIVESILVESRQNQILDIPSGVQSDEYRQALKVDAQDAPWYTGPEDGDLYWPELRERLLAGPLAEVVDDIDAASTKVVAHFANPGTRRLKKKGLVVGYVQSGKTANYTAVMAKAADAGYRMFVVMSGLHNNLRRQTQVRIAKDLGTTHWFGLTNADQDFGRVANGAALFAGNVYSIAVVKKNASRLRRLRDWLRDIDEDIRARCPILILDDEADQATPNSLAAREQVSRINELIRQIWAEVPTGSYVGYTATPFANVFMNPDDKEDLYPSNFILDLPRPTNYFGAERIFGRSALDDADEPDPGLDMVREVTEDEAMSLRPPIRREDRLNFEPNIPPSLQTAIRWFVLASAVRRARGQGGQHSSMLIHTTQFIAPHFAMKDSVEDLIGAIRLEEPDSDAWRSLYEHEIERVPDVSSESAPNWHAVSVLIPEVLSDLRVVVDNGSSTDRLDYDRKDDDGNPVAETVVAIGGGTLSRGLTLEGLVVSYFTRTSNTYDTLLQMGRWFGYRPGYEDLPRIWMPRDLREDFEFLSLVEEEIRQDMHRLENLHVTPEQFGLRVRAHPGRLSITSANRMAHASLVQVTYAGQRHQTIVLHEKERSVLQRNLDAAKTLMAGCSKSGTQGIATPARTQFFDVSLKAITTFLAEFEFHERQPGLRSDYVVEWIERVVPESHWNVAFLGSSRRLTGPDGETVSLGTVDLGLPYEVPMVNRAPLADVHHAANIKALLSQQDWVADFDPDLVSDLRSDGSLSYERIRRDNGDGSGLLIVYAVSPHSIPMRVTQAKSRRPMHAELPVMALGIVFPDAPLTGAAADASYYSVRPDWNAINDEEFDLPEDREGSATLDASQVRAEDIRD